MTKFEMLSTFWNTNVFFIELIGCLLLVFFYFASKQILQTFTKQNIFTNALLFTLSFFSAFLIGLALSGFISNSDIKPFLIPQIVIFESIIKGLTKAFNGSILYQGYFYIFTAQILGSILGFACFYFYCWLVAKIQKQENNFIVLILPTKNLKTQPYLWKELFFNSLLTLILLIVPRIPFSANLNEFDHLIVLFVLMLFFFIFTSNLGFVTFNLWTKVIATFLAFVLQKNKLIIQNFYKELLIDAGILISVPTIISLILLGVANSSNLTFNL